FFEKLQVLDGNHFKDEIARQRAIHLLQFLATGVTQLPDYELLLPKFLCALPFEIPIEREVNITKEEKEESEKLLQVMIDHWGALGTTTPDGLREGFLQRAGKLEKRQNGWYLQIENRTIDMLLNQLPWNLSMIQLPWMKELLRVEWY
ncbi:MAG: contractile injection system tape measure protein, partial [Bacteroidota bacterium]